MHHTASPSNMQILNVYSTSYDSGGRMWPIVHNTTVFSLVLTQIIALGVFGIKESQMASFFTIPLLIVTLLFSEYCKKHFYPIFRDLSAQVCFSNCSSSGSKFQVAWFILRKSGNCRTSSTWIETTSSVGGCRKSTSNYSVHTPGLRRHHHRRPPVLSSCVMSMGNLTPPCRSQSDKKLDFDCRNL